LIEIEGLFETLQSFSQHAIFIPPKVKLIFENVMLVLNDVELASYLVEIANNMAPKYLVFFIDPIKRLSTGEKHRIVCAAPSRSANGHCD